MTRKRGRPKGGSKLNKDTDETVCLLFACGASFAKAAEAVDVTREALFMRMAKKPDVREQYYRHRALGVEVRKAILEDCIMEAVERVASDPRYSVLAIFTAKAMLKWSDIPENIVDDGGIKEVLAKIVEHKKSLAGSQQSPAREFLIEASTKTGERV